LPHASAAPPAAGVAAAPAFLDIAAQAGCADVPQAAGFPHTTSRYRALQPPETPD